MLSFIVDPVTCISRFYTTFNVFYRNCAHPPIEYGLYVLWQMLCGKGYERSRWLLINKMFGIWPDIISGVLWKTLRILIQLYFMKTNISDDLVSLSWSEFLIRSSVLQLCRVYNQKMRWKLETKLSELVQIT